IVEVDGRIVLDASYSPAWTGKLTGWESDSPDSGKFFIGKSDTAIIYGDWIRLSKGRVVSINVLVGEIPGGYFSSYLWMEQEGEPYRKINGAGGVRSVLPFFKMAEIPEGLKQQMNVRPDDGTFDGSVFGAGR
ncbi:MAG: hypothetical protein PHP93_07500, partial [Kiritimatiellales bacterium]|nr:hypothetical protein [Kiritimatiellales bacterium]